MANGKELTVEMVRAALDYDPETGVFIWRNRPDMPAQWNSRFPGTQAGCHPRYRYIGILLFGKRYYAHRLAWLHFYGKWPKDLIDHKNGDPSDNRLSNLRECTHSENHQNKMKKPGGKPGYIGVGFQKKAGRWQAYITIDYKMTHLGFFDTPEKARAAYLKAKRTLHPFQPVPSR